MVVGAVGERPSGRAAVADGIGARVSVEECVRLVFFVERAQPRRPFDEDRLAVGVDLDGDLQKCVGVSELGGAGRLERVDERDSHGAARRSRPAAVRA